jgi:hypothetical protein
VSEGGYSQRSGSSREWIVERFNDPRCREIAGKTLYCTHHLGSVTNSTYLLLGMDMDLENPCFWKYPMA